jgi:hypothetical protein
MHKADCRVDPAVMQPAIRAGFRATRAGRLALGDGEA